MTTLQDARFALRMMRRAPGFTCIALLLLAVGIGANAAVFAAVNAVLLRSLPYHDTERLVFVRENGPSETSRGMRAGIPDYHDWRTQSQSFADLAAYASTGFNVVRGDGAERVQAQVVSANFARTLGVQPALGRFFTDEESRPGNAPVVVVSHRFWQRALGGRAEALGATLALDARPYTVVGVMPAGFVAPEAADIWIPLGFFTGPVLEWRANHMLEIVGRLRPGTPVGQAQQELNAVAARIWATDRLMSGWTVELTPLNDVMLGPTRPALLTMLAAVTAVMLIVCANVASLLLARAAARRQEIAVRVALGASLGRVARQLLTESGVLAASGGVLGVGVAYAVMGAIDRAAVSHLGHFVSLRLDFTVVAYVAAIAVTTALLLSVAPLLHLRQHRIGVARTRGGATDPGRRILTPLVAGEVAASVTLLVLAVLLVSSFDRLLRTDPGFSTDRTLSFRVTLPPATYQGPGARLAMYERVRARLAALPGVSAVGLTSSLPFSRPGERRSNSLFVQSRHGDDATGALRTDLDPNAVPKADVRYVDAGFFSAMGLRLSRGVVLDATADMSSAPQAVINRTAATRVFGDSDPIGQRIAVGSDPSTWRTVVGVVDDVTNRGLREQPVEEVYLSHQHFAHASMAVLVRTSADVGGMAQVVAHELAVLAPDVPAYDVRTMHERLVDSVGIQRLAALVMRALALVAFVLAVSGLYGVLAYLVSRRAHELGIRMALGATSGDVVTMVMRQAMLVVAPGIGVGLVGAVGAAHLARGQLYGVGVIEPAVLAGVAAVVLAASAVAVLLPARAGSRVDPMVALRSD